MLTRTALSVNPYKARVLPPAALAVLLAALAAAPPALAEPPVAGQSINMVSGKTIPGGDPFLQRQNEPSLAVSSRNPRHLLAGANDYRTVDLPGLANGTETGDSWLGLFKSFDGGETWQSTLVPGFPQDTSPEGLASPLKGYTAAADPIVRAGTHGLFYYGGIVFNRTTNLGLLEVTTFLDLNNKENGSVAAARDPIRFAGTVVVDTGTSGQFLDKPWIGVDVPRAGALSRTFNVGGAPQTVACGNLYMAWAKFTGSQSTKIMLSRSRDCGTTWENPTKLSESSSINQGTVVSVGPDGATHQMMEDFALARVLPGMKLIAPCDYEEAKKAVKAVAEFWGPVVIRYGREAVPILTTKETPFQIGRAETYLEGIDLTIIACGVMVYLSLLAAQALEKEGVHARVINCHTIKPIDKEAILRAAQETGAIVTAEEHQVMAGFGSAVAEIVVQDHPVPMEFVGMKDRFGESGKPWELLKAFGMMDTDIVAAAHRVLERKK